ncbi:hypothetical protein G6011_07140 [Alternaria panax]|uniref:Uncharacterized protein n=1 Tax=Alternaria panax TaxID=48097 RepID=A0AAD4FE19_9PLEO|nr:hypothetical protein G6011_07140 [Alternaria panax]
MATITSATQEAAQLTKPADWALHMVTASLKFSCSSDAPVLSYTTPDAGRLDVLNLGLDFAQAMRFRRALVNDVFVALEKAGIIDITSETGVLGTPWSSSGKRRVATNVGMRMSERKRHCRRDSSDSEIARDEEVPYYETDRFLAKGMRSLIDSAGFPVDDCIASLDEGERVSEEDLANIVQDLLAQNSNAEDGLQPMKRVGNVGHEKSSKEQAPRMSSPELGTHNNGAKGMH